MKSSYRHAPEQEYSACVKYVHDIASSIAVVGGSTLGRTRAEARKAIAFYRALGWEAWVIDISVRCKRCEGRSYAKRCRCRACGGKGFIVVEGGR